MRELDIATQLRRFAEAAEALVPSSTKRAPTPTRSPSPGWRGRAAGIAASVLVLAAIVAAALAVGHDGGGEVQVATGAGDETSAAGGWSTFAPAPISARTGPVSVVAGDELVVWGGWNGDVLGDGAAYSVTDGTWRVVAPAPLAPRQFAVAAWTGTEVLVLGGVDENFEPLLDSAAYSPGTDSWRSLPPRLDGAITADSTGAAWTGEELVLVGVGRTGALAYDPAVDGWRSIDVAAGPAERFAGRREMAAEWTGSEVLVVEITDGETVTIDRLDPTTGQWGTAVMTEAIGSGTAADLVVWTGSEVLVIGQHALGARFDPSSDVAAGLAPSMGGLRSPAVVAGSAVMVGARWLDLPTMTWQPAQPPPGPFREFPAAAGDGEVAYYWGGNACGAVASCAGVVDPGIGLRWSPPPPGEASIDAANRAYALEHLGARASFGDRLPPVWDSVTELLPNVLFRFGSDPAEALVAGVVVGRITDVAPGQSQVPSGEDEPDTSVAEFDHPGAIARTVHLTVDVDERIGTTDVADFIQVGLGINGEIDAQRVMDGLEALGTVVLFLDEGGAVFDYDPSLYSVFAGGAYLATVEDEGNLTFVQESGDAPLTPEGLAMLAGVTLDGIRSAADEPELVIAVNTADGIPRRE